MSARSSASWPVPSSAGSSGVDRDWPISLPPPPSRDHESSDSPRFDPRRSAWHPLGPAARLVRLPVDSRRPLNPPPNAPAPPCRHARSGSRPSRARPRRRPRRPPMPTRRRPCPRGCARLRGGQRPRDFVCAHPFFEGRLRTGQEQGGRDADAECSA